MTVGRMVERSRAGRVMVPMVGKLVKSLLSSSVMRDMPARAQGCY